MRAVILTLMVFMASVASPAFASTPGEVPLGGVLRDVPMQGLDGPSRKFSDFRGKPLIINVWASWCGPCRDEMGSLLRLSRRYGGREFNVVGISTDDYVDRAKLFLRRFDVSYSNFIDSRLVLENMLGAERLPLTLLVDPRGVVLARFYGAKEWDSPEAVALIGKAFGLRLQPVRK
jgi:thiol-disulfide isomerase/thioredoxin